MDLQASPVLTIPTSTLQDKQLDRVLENFQYKVFRLLTSPKNKQELIHELAKICNFPSYFGNNWDALADALKDFHWYSAKGYVIILQNPWTIPLSDLDIFYDIVCESSTLWKEEKVSLKLLIPP